MLALEEINFVPNIEKYRVPFIEISFFLVDLWFAYLFSTEKAEKADFFYRINVFFV